ncbi:hypothetical protein NLO413_0739 [Candidatus Neoehrlichia lotoris str. RAC413]|uniref:Uncharacterized protein n=1 Tax=Candidatus Neoehrlichia procyonis str. RAC413 TaxID=1359163 RepID=A0A0F3NMR8_9RICK|nr:hypothetical protein NLO413_0739 [Candidatus Neoehrlichia lotoris str. RAC413]
MSLYNLCKKHILLVFYVFRMLYLIVADEVLKNKADLCQY